MHHDTLNKLSMNPDDYVEGELYDDEIKTILAGIDRINTMLSPKYRMKAEIINGHILLDGMIEIAPAINVTETIADTVYYRAALIGEWHTVYNYPAEPDDVDIVWDDTPLNINRVAREVARRIIASYLDGSDDTYQMTIIREEKYWNQNNKQEE